MISNEDAPEVQEWFRSLRPDQIMEFVNALSENNQRWITRIAQQNTTHQQKKHELWERAFDRNQNRVYWQNRRTRETHWEAAMTGGSGALDACTGIPYHVPLD